MQDGPFRKIIDKLQQDSKYLKKGCAIKLTNIPVYYDYLKLFLSNEDLYSSNYVGRILSKFHYNYKEKDKDKDKDFVHRYTRSHKLDYTPFRMLVNINNVKDRLMKDSLFVEEEFNKIYEDKKMNWVLFDIYCEYLFISPSTAVIIDDETKYFSPAEYEDAVLANKVALMYPDNYKIELHTRKQKPYSWVINNYAISSEKLTELDAETKTFFPKVQPYDYIRYINATKISYAKLVTLMDNDLDIADAVIGLKNIPKNIYRRMKENTGYIIPYPQLFTIASKLKMSIKRLYKIDESPPDRAYTEKQLVKIFYDLSKVCNIYELEKGFPTISEILKDRGSLSPLLYTVLLAVNSRVEKSPFSTGSPLLQKEYNKNLFIRYDPLAAILTPLLSCTDKLEEEARQKLPYIVPYNSIFEYGSRLNTERIPYLALVKFAIFLETTPDNLYITFPTPAPDEVDKSEKKDKSK